MTRETLAETGCSWRFRDDERPAGGIIDAVERDFARVSGLFPGNPFEDGDWAARASRLAEGWRRVHGGSQGEAEHRRRLAEALSAHAARLDAPEASRANAARLADPDTLVVVAGQQAGLFTGPAYTVYKAATAVRLAEARSRELGRPVVPVFWVAGEDHDFQEAAATWAIGRDGRPLPLALPPGPVLRSVGTLPIPASAVALRDRLLESIAGAAGRSPEGGQGTATGASPADDWASRIVSETLEASATLGEWFARQMLALLGERGLVLLDPMDPALRELAATPLAGLAERLDEVREALAAGEAAVASLGFPVQMRMNADDAHIFRYEGGRRLALARAGGRVATRAGEWSVAEADLARAIRDEPSRFSPAAALRPLVQDWLLPTLAQVVGPGEMAYLPETAPAYGLVGIEPPIRVPRLTATVVWPEWARALEEWGVDPETLADGESRRAALAERLARMDGVDVRRVFASAREAVARLYGELERDLSRVSPHLSRIGDVNRRHVEWQVDYFERKALAHQRRVHRDVRDAWETMAELLFPRGAGQDRQYCVYALFGRFPKECLDDLLFSAPLAPRRSFAFVAR